MKTTLSLVILSITTIISGCGTSQSCVCKNNSPVEAAAGQRYDPVKNQTIISDGKGFTWCVPGNLNSNVVIHAEASEPSR